VIFLLGEACGETERTFVHSRNDFCPCSAIIERYFHFLLDKCKNKVELSCSFLKNIRLSKTLKNIIIDIRDNRTIDNVHANLKNLKNCGKDFMLNYRYFMANKKIKKE